MGLFSLNSSFYCRYKILNPKHSLLECLRRGCESGNQPKSVATGLQFPDVKCAFTCISGACLQQESCDGTTTRLAAVNSWAQVGPTVKGKPELNLLPFMSRAPVNMHGNRTLKCHHSGQHVPGPHGPGVGIVEDEKWVVPGDTCSRYPEHGNIHCFVFSGNNSTFCMETGSLDH